MLDAEARPLTTAAQCQLGLASSAHTLCEPDEQTRTLCANAVRARRTCTNAERALRARLYSVRSTVACTARRCAGMGRV